MARPKPLGPPPRAHHAAGLVVPAIAALLAVSCADDRIDKARAAIDAGQPDVAIPLLAALITDEPTNERALVALGDANLLVSSRQLAARDVAGATTAKAKAGEAYASAANSPAATCLGKTRDYLVRSATPAQAGGKERFDAVWAECPSALLLTAPLASRANWLTDDLLREYRKALTVNPEGWSAGPGFGEAVATGTFARVVSSAPVDAPPVHPNWPSLQLVPFDDVAVLEVNGDQATVIAADYPVGIPSTAWVRNDDHKPANQRCDARSGALFGYSWCKKGKHLEVEVVAGSSEDGKRIADPPLGDVTCTGRVLGRPKGHDDVCEVQYLARVVPRRVVQASALVVEPKTAREREGRLKAVVGAVASDYLEHLGRGELAPGIPAVDVGAVDPGCRPDPLMDAAFAGESIKFSCVGKFGSFDFRDGLLLEAKWLPNPPDAVVTVPDDAVGD